MKILTADDLASILGLKRKTVIDFYTKQPGFPAPLTPRKPRWLASEVERFMLLKSVQKANNASEPA